MQKFSKTQCLKEIKSRTFVGGSYEQTTNGMIIKIELGATMSKSNSILDELKKINSRLDGIDSRLDGIDSRLDGIDDRLDGIDSRLDVVEKRLDGIDDRLDKNNLIK